ncbi:hypothetical protein [Agrobacterium fabrum]|uniref:hypothetical protein n=1 Tax=Agrobacterium fabrum TaxID=1176649 RepID=UPI00215896FA|nr:hypothetical protein [Agrobacterium fabrum]MCR6727857.1 hypothetical protein [Agrobacterium fabrum]
MVSIAGLSADSDVNQAWARFGAFAFVESCWGRTENIARFLLGRFHNTFSFRNDQLVQICEHCEECLAPKIIRSGVMNGFVRLGQRRLLVNERLLLFSSAVALTEFAGGTVIAECDVPLPDYAMMLTCDTERKTAKRVPSNCGIGIARNDYAIIVKSHDGHELFRDGLNDDLNEVTATIGTLGLVLTQLHLAQPSSPYCGSPGTSFSKPSNMPDISRKLRR